MPPRRLKKKSIKRLVEKRVAKAIEEYEKSRANLDSAGSSGGNPGNAGGTMNVHNCLIEKVEQVFETCKCAEEDKVMFAASTFEGRALTWWNGNLALMCPELVPTEKKKIERYTRGFPERIKGNITSSKPATLHDAHQHARELVDKRSGRQETARAYAAALTENRGYAGNLPKCNRCNFHHSGRCPPKCQKCQRTSHLEKDYRAILPEQADAPKTDQAFAHIGASAVPLNDAGTGAHCLSRVLGEGSGWHQKMHGE
ncbi:hypothetical protein Tco_0569223 [Tanacetum coccineum]